ncbi:hypothetical protein NDU88_006548 [Pleurodeles waltl]|uniref:Uncharacterized protein n=1 Tax=Pleurodeles waltl TaxID=8319 RepID=A0AAV7WXW2_PLEWA|nr:hypothetical protein NDU88_006548 [Pleurodeles waltl]
MHLRPSCTYVLVYCVPHRVAWYRGIRTMTCEPDDVLLPDLRHVHPATPIASSCHLTGTQTVGLDITRYQIIQAYELVQQFSLCNRIHIQLRL